VAENLMPIQVGDMTVVTRHEVAHAKPNPELLLEATRRLRVDPSTPWR
jgi:beta-phosphoglucomutase-like phosphatase (HAD superfamily)